MSSSNPNPSPTLLQDEHDGPPSDTGRIARIGLWTIGVGFGGFLLWAAFAPLDEGVPSQAIVSVETKRKPVQHQQGGTVVEVMVREGQEVAAGDVLLRLGDKVARANHTASRQRYYGLRAAESRLLAEQLGTGRIAFHPDLGGEVGADPLIRQQLLTQEQLFNSRRNALGSAVAALEESIRGYEAQITTLDQVLANRREQSRLIERELAGVRGLVAEGYAPLTRQLELERVMADVMGSISEALGGQARMRSAILETRQRIQTQRAEYRKEVESQLAEVQREVEAEQERFKAVAEDLVRTEIRAPAAGQVVGLTVQSAGAVIAPGQKIMDIVPRNETLMLDAQIPPHVIDRVRPDQPVDVRFSGFAHSPQLVVEGTLVSLSTDILVDEATRVPYYLGRVAITPEGLRQLGNRQLQPGMQAEVVIRGGERSLLTYLLHPLTKRIAASMKEE
jgi:protease secretion system membrane fusion protein